MATGPVARCREAGAAGLIAGGVDLRDVLDPQLTLLEQLQRDFPLESQATLRKLLGANALSATGDSLGLATTALDCDVWRFEAALRAGDWEQAVTHYRGPFMDGFFLEGAPIFEERLFEERQRLERAWRGAVESLAGDAERAGRHRDAAQAWQLLFAHDPLDSAVAGKLELGKPIAFLPANKTVEETERIDGIRDDLLDALRSFEQFDDQRRRPGEFKHLVGLPGVVGEGGHWQADAVPRE